MSHFNSKQHSLGRRAKRTIQQQFVHHCAVVIQSKMRGYIQRKKYKAFLPIYRRVRELFLAIFNGWKTRRILKLPPIKSQISEIRLKMKNGQVSSARIAKRELADEMERLGKKGRWIEVYQRFKMMKSSKNPFDGKQNSSLYGNIKSKSIKNVFKEPSVKIDKQKSIKQAKVFKQETFACHKELPIEDIKSELTNLSLIDYDQRPLKGIHSISVCPTQPETSQILQNQVGSRHEYLKKNPKKEGKKIIPKTSRAKNEKSIPKRSIQTQKLAVSEQGFQNGTKSELMKCSQVSKSSQASKKLRVTLASNMMSSVKSIQSIRAISESAIDMKTMQVSRASLSFSKPELNLEVLQVYQDKYLKQKARIVEKLVGLDFRYTEGAGKNYKEWLCKY